MKKKSERKDNAPEDKPLGAGGSSFDLINAEALFGALGLRKGSALLDIACGRGAYTLAAAEYVGPPREVRLDAGETERLVSPFGFVKEAALDLGPYNYLLTFRLRPQQGLGSVSCRR